jgi:cobalt-zinc-cadmium resistance protein CzcA
MIRGLVDFALNNRIMVIAFAVLLFIWGGISFHQLPVEAYPDVANNYVEVITQWPGISAEQIEQQVTIPLEIVMNGIPHLTALRSFSLFGLSDLKMTFDDEAANDWNREKVLERLAQVTLPNGVQPQMGTDWSPVGQIYFFTLQSTNPRYDVMELKSLEDWVVEKSFKSVPNVVDVASFGGPTREYQVRIDPGKLISYGLSIGQVENQLTNNNTNAGGSFIESGLQQIDIREVGLVRDVHDIENTMLTTKTGTALRVKDIGVVEQGPKIRLGQFARARHLVNGKIVDDDDVVSGIVLLRKGADSDSVLEGIHDKVKELNTVILPHGVKVVPFLDRSDLGAAQPDRRHHPGCHHPFPVPGKCARRDNRSADDSVFAAICGHLSAAERHPGEPAVAWRAGLRHGRRRRGRDGGEHRAPSFAPSRRRHADGDGENT